MLADVAVWYVFAVGVLHLLIMAGELLPCSSPVIMTQVLKSWKPAISLDAEHQRLVATIVHNAGTYNGVVGAALISTTFTGPGVLPVQVVLLTGVIVAGVVGLTLSWKTVFQAISGVIGLSLIAASGALHS